MSIRRIGIDRKATTNALEVNGNALKTDGNGDWLTSSDRRLKKNIIQLEGDEILNRLLQLKGVTFEWDDPIKSNNRPEGTIYGLIAQDIENAFPELVSTDIHGYLTTTYSTYDAMYVEVIRLLDQRISDLENENREKEESLDELEERLSRIETLLESNK